MEEQQALLYLFVLGGGGSWNMQHSCTHRQDPCGWITVNKQSGELVPWDEV